MTARKAQKAPVRRAPRWAWHIHHSTLVEPVLEEYDGSLAERRRYIKNRKPQHEQALRLRLLKYVKGRMPRELTTVVSHTRGAPNTARRAAHSGASRAALAAVERLHKKECPNCPWTGSTIFPKA